MDSWVGGVQGFFSRFFVFYMAVLGVGMGPNGLIASWRFKTLDSQPEKSNKGPVSMMFHDFRTFQKSGDDSMARYLPCFRPGAPRKQFPSVSVGTKKMGDEKLCRFVVVSPREVPYSTFSFPFKIFKFRSF